MRISDEDIQKIDDDDNIEYVRQENFLPPAQFNHVPVYVENHNSKKMCLLSKTTV